MTWKSCHCRLSRQLTELKSRMRVGNYKNEKSNKVTQELTFHWNMDWIRDFDLCAVDEMKKFEICTRLNYVSTSSPLPSSHL